MSINGNWLRVDSNTPCGVCGLKSESCHQSLTTGIWFCHTAHENDAPHNFTFLGICDQAGRYRMFIDDTQPFAATTTNRVAKATKSDKKKKADAGAKGGTFLRAVAKLRTKSRPRLLELAGLLGLPPSDETLRAMDALEVHYLPNDGYNQDCWVYPERTADGTICAWQRRPRIGRKMSWGVDPSLPGRGLFIPSTLFLSPGAHLLCPEGLSDTLTMTLLGVQCVGRPSDLAGGEELSKLINLRTLATPAAPLGSFPIVIIGENDRDQETGKWPGREGAIKIATQQAKDFGMPVWWYLDPDGIKDLRVWFQQAFKREPTFEEMRECLFGMIDEHHEIAIHTIERPQPKHEVHATPTEPIRVVGSNPTPDPNHKPVNRIANLPPTQTLCECEAAAARERMRCLRPNEVLMRKNGSKHDYCIGVFPCKKSICPGCRRYKLEQFCATIDFHLVLSSRAAMLSAIYLFYCQKDGDDPATSKQWTNVAERIRKNGGDYVRIDTDGAGRCLCASNVAPLPGQLSETDAAAVQTVTPSEAAAALKAAVRAVPEYCARPFASSRRWKMISDGEKSEWNNWTRIGSVYGNLKNLEDILIARGAERLKWIEKRQRFFRYQALEFTLHLPDYQFERLCVELEEGQQLYCDEDFKREPVYSRRDRGDGDAADNSGTESTVSPLVVQGPFH